MKETIDCRGQRNDNCVERELIEQQFLEKFAALEEGLALLQENLRSMSATVKLFSGLAQHIRRSTCPTTDHRDEIRCRHGRIMQ